MIKNNQNEKTEYINHKGFTIQVNHDSDLIDTALIYLNGILQKCFYGHINSATGTAKNKALNFINAK